MHYSSYSFAVATRLVSTLSAFLVGFISLWLYGRYLTPEQYGAVLVAVQILGYLPLVNSGFRTTINQKLLAGKCEGGEDEYLLNSQRLFSWLWVIQVGLAGLAMVVYQVMPVSRAAGVNLVYYLVLGWVYTVSYYCLNQAGLLLGLKMQGLLFLISAIQCWCLLLGLWLGFRTQLGVWAFLVSNLVGTAGTLPWTWYVLRRVKPKLPLVTWRRGPEFWTWLRRIQSDAFACMRNEGSIMLMFTADLVLVGAFCSARETAVYGVLSRFLGILRGFLQTFGEAAWPIIASKGAAHRVLSDPLLRVNAWVYGSAIGALAPTLIPLCHWLLGKKWTATPLIVGLVVTRTLIVGLWSAAGYCMMGMGHFQILRRYVERELAVSIALALPLGIIGRMEGIAAAFLLSTVAGTLFPLFGSFARAIGISVWTVLWRVWPRAIVAVLASSLTTWTLVARAQRIWELLAAAAAGAVAGLVCGLGWAWLRQSRQPTPSAGRYALRELLKQC